MKQLTIAVSRTDEPEKLQQSLEALSGKDSRVEIIAFYEREGSEAFELIQQYKDRFPQQVRGMKTESAEEESAFLSALQEAEGRYFRILFAGDRIPEESMKPVLDRMEEIDADVIITGYEKHKIEHSPALSCNGRQIDMIKLSDKFREIRRFLRPECLNYNAAFLKDAVLRIAEGGTLSDQEYAVLPFIEAETFFVLPDVFYEYGKHQGLLPEEKTEEELEALKPEVRRVVSYFESCKPLGKARSVFLENYIGKIILNYYRALRGSGLTKKSRIREASDFQKWLSETDPGLERSMWKGNIRTYFIVKTISLW